MERAYFSASIADFIAMAPDEVLGRLTRASEFPVEPTQRDAWAHEIDALQTVLPALLFAGTVHLEFVIPRLGKRIDAVLVLPVAIVLLEFKVGAAEFNSVDLDQVWDYALDLKNFHETSHRALVIPVLVATAARNVLRIGATNSAGDDVSVPSLVSGDRLGEALQQLCGVTAGEPLDPTTWAEGRYRPTPTIVEAASALFRGNSVEDIWKRDAGARNLAETSRAIVEVIRRSRRESLKSICLVTGVPGAGKTLVGLDIATRFRNKADRHHGVYLSGNGPLVSVLTEALVRDDVAKERQSGKLITKSQSRQRVKAFIQAVHHYRDEYLKDPSAPTEHVAIFDEAQRAWTLEKTADFMQRKKGRPGFALSEPDFLISCLDRHTDWAVVVCLIGGGQEINTGEAGIGEWMRALQRSYPEWHIHLSPQLSDSEYAAELEYKSLAHRANVNLDPALHLSTSMRSFRAEKVSTFVKNVLDLEIDVAKGLWSEFRHKYPVVLTRNVERARAWLRTQARGNERFGIVVSSQAQRLKPHAIDVRSPMDPVHWFLSNKSDVRSSYYLEDVATEFHVQGLELDWAAVVWDGDMRLVDGKWNYHSFVGDRWQNIHKHERRAYLKNAYRVLLTRARQGMVIVVPEGATSDPTRSAAFYDGTYQYLQQIGLPVLTA